MSPTLGQSLPGVLLAARVRREADSHECDCVVFGEELLITWSGSARSRP